ncbi:hypothetical protein G6F31_018515 [Rhizopus arrhizus]|nr:hypothetical protein G6F31_018515 [Rhizopus arrhizus]
MRKQRIRLEHHRDAALGGRQVGHVAVADAERARGRRVQAGDHAQRGRLAATRRAQQDREAACRHGEAHAVDRGGAAILFGEVIQNDG